MTATPDGLPLLLASGSPRRRELLSLYGIPFTVLPSQAEERATGPGEQRVQKIAQDKCDEVADRSPDRYVLAADTLVCVEGHVLGKPKDPADALAMLALLSGKWHQVHTGVCLRGPNALRDVRVATTRVRFLPLSRAMMERYVKTGEPLDKAGAYAIQGISGIFIDSLEGSPSNVIGLPLALVGQMLENAGFTLPLLPAE